MKKLRLVVVHWQDIHESPGWGDDWLHEGALLDCREVGWVVHQDRHKITLARGLCDPESKDRATGSYVTIPMSSVTLIQRLVVK
jgi:hypothetical protein